MLTSLTELRSCRIEGMDGDIGRIDDLRRSRKRIDNSPGDRQ